MKHSLNIHHNTFKIIILFSFFFITPLYPDDIETREKELSNVQKQIELQRQMAQEAEEKRTSALQSKQQTQSQYNTIQNRVRELNKTQQNLRQGLEQTKQLKDQTEDKISRIQFTSNQTMLYLLLADQAETILKKTENDNYFLSIYVKNLIDENRKLNQEITRITSDTRAREAEIRTATNRTQEEQSRLNTINSDLKKIDEDISNYENQKKIFQETVAELERSATALQNLINQLKIDERNIQLTYIFASGVVAPVKGRIITPFGPKRNERYNVSTISNGIEISVPINTKVQALSDGEVVYADIFTGSGRMIIIDHKNGFHSIYAFNNRLMVQKGDTVTKGQIIAETGQFSNETEPSLRFEIRRNGVAVNPIEYVTVYP